MTNTDLEKKKHTKVRCIYPFSKLYVYEQTGLSPCCEPWFRKPVANLLDQDLDTAWNSEEVQKVRASMYEGGNPEKYCHTEVCPIYRSGEWYDLDENPFEVDEALIEEVREGKTEIENGPLYIELANDFRCNYKCSFCSSWKRGEGPGGDSAEIIELLKSRFDKVQHILLLSSGELFTRPKLLDFLESIDSNDYPGLQFSIITNGSLVTPERWKKISHLNLFSVNVSIDAANAETYSQIRVNGKWDNLLENLQFISQRRKANDFKQFQINMAVMDQNHDQMVDFAKLGVSLEVDEVYFSWLHSIPENSVPETYNWNALQKIEEQLNDPIMENPRVVASVIREWWKWFPDSLDGPMTVREARKRILADLASKVGCSLTGVENQELMKKHWSDWVGLNGDDKESLKEWIRTIVLRSELIVKGFDEYQFARGFLTGLVHREDPSEGDVKYWQWETMRRGKADVLEEILENRDFTINYLDAFTPLD